MLRNNYPLNQKASESLKVLLCFLFIFQWFCFSSFAQERSSYDAQGKRDPFLALVTSDGRLLNLEPIGGIEGISVEGIIFSKDGTSYAVVNGEVVKENDKIGKYEVKKIEEKKITVIKDGQTIEVILEKEE